MDPVASRPFMPGYGVVGPDQGSGLLPWSWAEERLAASRYYWVATVWPDGRPHVTPVWGTWDDDAVWFSCSPGSRKARNLGADARCAVTTEDAVRPVILEGMAERQSDRAGAERFAEQLTAKYGEDISVDFVLDNALYRVAPIWAFGLDEEDFTGSPTRWAPSG
ncbi:MAG TPA: pyridoxamine 5'-phosphate oxidase family protein [Acidimicrobiales bacterium]|jgi:PPOX class probable F420-dependent enzyme|nr:pyridoxamine 5'-phosphate oxidase family protein [Acidimicrobiales bacterium]